jgi:predicted phage terminase large subunit-like protein
MASTQDGGDYTASCLMRKDSDHYYICDVTAWQMSPRLNEVNVRRMAESDPKGTAIRMEQEPGSSGVAVIDHYKRNVLQGFDFEGVGTTGSKVIRATPFSAACEAGKVSIVEGAWNDMFLDQLTEFPYGEHDDMVDAAALAFNTLSEKDRFNSDRLTRMIVR